MAKRIRAVGCSAQLELFRLVFSLSLFALYEPSRASHLSLSIFALSITRSIQRWVDSSLKTQPLAVVQLFGSTVGKHSKKIIFKASHRLWRW